MIDYSNGYPVQITTDVNANTPWKEVFKKNSNLKKIFLDWSNDSWRPSNYENVEKDPHCEAYKNVFVKLRNEGGHIHDMSYFKALARFEKKYKSSKKLKQKIDRYLELTEMNYRSMKNGGWKNPFGELKAYGSKLGGLNPFCHYEDTELGKEYKQLEYELTQIFRNI
jgi:hypothetical protein